MSGETGSWGALRDPSPRAVLLEAVRIGPSASNKQPWRHVEVAVPAEGLGGAWERLLEAPIAEPGARRYIATWSM